MTTAIVTGGSRGLGLALALGLVGQGWDVIIDARGSDDLDRALSRLGPTARAVAGDVTDARHRSELIDAARRTGRLDLVVNNAGGLGPTPLPRLAHADLAAFGGLFDVNVISPLALIQEALPLLVENGGSVINVTSDAAVEAYEGWGLYGATKAALEQVSHILSVEEPSVRVWWLDPGDMRTAMHQAAFPGEDISDRPPPETVVPSILSLLTVRPPSGRVRASELLVEVER
jgi:NAD(P)-dependent dehydrogenase (short-subunit alcohol dehydrogenase family)